MDGLYYLNCLLQTRSFVVEVVVVLRHVSDNAQFVWNGHCQHVLGVEQRRNAEMIAGHIKRLQHRIASSVKVSLTEKTEDSAYRQQHRLHVTGTRGVPACSCK